MTGRTLGHYRILDQLGEGGMGVVYRALDTSLDRTVALKVLREEATANPDRKRRFVTEAKTASALNHPNIVTIYEIGSDQGVDFIAMEYIHGQTLGQRLGPNGLSIAEAMPYALQIADALGRAHAAGIVHRDLKPANVMVTEDDRVKVLDFGLAKLTEAGDSDDSGATRTMPAKTQEGTILGTAAYMSPEQAEGKKVDARSDIFAFGLVLYEMLTGRRAFSGDTNMAVLAAILHREPEIEGLPKELKRIIARCLRKDPRRRFQAIDDVKISLEDMEPETEPAAAPAPVMPPLPKPRRGLAIAAAVVIGAAGVGVGWWLGARRGASVAPFEGPVLTRLTSDAGLTTEPALSADGKLLAYVSDRAGKGNLDIWVQQVAGGEPLQLTRDEADEREPSFSPDGSRVAFRSERAGGGVYVVSTLGGEPRKIVDHGRRPRFSPDGGTIAYWVGTEAPVRGASRIYVVGSNGGASRQIQPALALARWPVWSPDGKKLLFLGGSEAGDQPDWWIAPMDGGEAIRTGALAALTGRGAIPTRQDTVAPSVWVPEGNQVLCSARMGAGTNVWRIPISPDSGKVTDVPQRITFGSGLETGATVAAGLGQVAFAILNEQIDLWSLPLDAGRGKALAPITRLTQDPAADRSPHLSDDGNRLVFTASRSSAADVVMKDLKTGRQTPVAFQVPPDSGPMLTRDGSRVGYGRSENQKISFFAVDAGSSAEQRICEDCGSTVWDWSSNGTQFLLRFQQDTEMIVLDAATGQKRVLLRRPGRRSSRARFAPDDRWVAFHERLGPQVQVFIVPFRDGPVADSDWITVTGGEALNSFPHWSPDGRILYFLSNRDGKQCLWAQPLEAASKRPAGAPLVVQHFHDPRLSPANMNLTWFGMSVAQDKLVLNLGETTGSIWMAQLREQTTLSK